MTERYVFHLSFPVSDLETSKRFYVDVLGAGIGRENDEWLDILLWGHQITLHQLPGDVLSRDRQGKRHFGVVLPWTEWQQLADRVRAAGVAFLKEPEMLLMGTPEEQGKFYLEDPSHNVIEVKAYHDLGATLKQSDAAYNYARA